VPCNQIGLPERKSVSIERIVGGRGKGRIVFVDDSHDNVKDMERNRTDVCTVGVEGGRGMEDREWGIIWEKMEEWGVKRG